MADRGEKIRFYTSNDEVTLLVNPEVLTLQWKKVYNRIRTKARVVTLFWGEEPIRFTYQGQTGYVYPNFNENDTAIKEYNTNIKSQVDAVAQAIQKYEEELRRGGPYTLGTVNDTKSVISQLKEQLKKTGSTLVPRTDLINTVAKHFTNTDLLYLSEKFKILKKLQALYKKHQTPSGELMKIDYRDYIFSGYFESFSYTDDAKNPWNWIYNIEFTILDWAENAQKRLQIDGEIKFINENSIEIKKITDAKKINT